jgi:hypothetical protein
MNAYETECNVIHRALVGYEIEAGELPSPSQNVNSPHPATSAQPQQLLQNAAPNLIAGETTSFEEQLRPTLSSLVSNNDFDALEKIAGGFRTSKSQTADGTWHLLSFYRVLCELPQKACEGRLGRLPLANRWFRAENTSSRM